MSLQAYKIHSKHRTAKPTEDASVWDVSEWHEIKLFADAGLRGWRTAGKDWFWSLDPERSVLGRGLAKGGGKELQLYIAKFVGDNRNWHGYPVHPRDSDIPPEAVLDAWLHAGYIDKTDKKRIKGGSFR